MDILLERICAEGDFVFVSLLTHDNAVMTMNMGRAFTREEARAYFDYMMACNGDHEKSGFFIISAKAGGERMGVCSLYRHGTDAEVEYMLLPAFWNKGIATAAVKELLHIAAQCGVRHVRGMTAPENMASQRVLIKNGFVFELMTENDDDHSPVAVYGIEL